MGFPPPTCGRRTALHSGFVLGVMVALIAMAGVRAIAGTGVGAFFALGKINRGPMRRTGTPRRTPTTDDARSASTATNATPLGDVPASSYTLA